MIKKISFFAVSLLIFCQSITAHPKSAEPWVFWYWMYGAVSDAGIRTDLHAMKDVGIGGFYLMPIKESKMAPQYNGDSDQLTANWWKRIDTVYKTADSLNLEMGIHFCDGFALAGGPWITEEESMQKVVHKDVLFDGDAKEIRSLSSLPNTIGVYAYPSRYDDAQIPKSSVSFPFSSKTPCEVVMTYKKPFTLRSLRIVTGGNNIQAHRWKVYASDDNKNYTFIRTIEPARRGWQDTDAYATYAIPATKAKYFKFCWSPAGSDPGSEDLDAAKWRPNLKVGGMILSSMPVVDNFEGKSGVVWRVAKETDYAECYSPDEVFKVNDANIHTLRKGKWHILWIGYESTGHVNATGGAGRGLECDKFSRQAVRKQFENWFLPIYKRVPQDVAGRVLKRLHVDSWECGSQNWNATFADEFRSRRGYDLLPWMPLFAGIPMVSNAKSDSVLRDVRLTIAELINDVFFDEVATLSKQYGLKLSCECVSPTMVSDGMVHYQHADYPMGEFWYNSPTHDKPNDMLDAVSGAHVYGKNIVQAEAFTAVRATWDETPAKLKPLLDRNLCLGINAMVYHVYTHNPWLDRQPGMTLDGIGNFFQRDNTWWKEMKAFNDYVSSCQALLQKGRPVVDIAVYTGNEVPRRALLPERLVTSLPGLFGPELVEREKVRLLNEGQPIEVSPVGVYHTANMTKADMFTNPLHGYKYDSFNHDALKGAKVESGELVTAGGMRYKVLVVPQPHKLNPNNINDIREKIDELKRQGLKVIEIAWTDGDLCALELSRDVTLPEGVDFCHRQTKDEDIYFLANLTDTIISFSPVFRAHRTHSYLYSPLTSKMHDFNGAITLNPYESVFVLMTEEAKQIEPQVKSLSSDTIALNNTWQITFEKTGKTIATKELFDWATSDDSAIKYYSGRATYKTSFDLSSSVLRGQCLLNLGTVKDVATVFVNGKQCGTSWIAPFVIDITSVVKTGKNELKVVVVNTWANALLGNDLGTPPFDGIWTNGKYRRADKTPLPAGLLSPIFLEVKK